MVDIKKYVSATFKVGEAPSKSNDGNSPIDFPLAVALGGTGASIALAARLNLGVPFGGEFSIQVADYDVSAIDGIIVADATAGGFVLTVDRGLELIFLVLKGGTDSNVVQIQDDGGNLRMSLLAGGQAFAIVAVTGGVVYANGVT